MNKLNAQQSDTLIVTLKARFEANMSRHAAMSWSEIEPQLRSKPEKLWVVGHMHHTGGEPDVVQFEKSERDIVFVDCSAESPTGRRSLCYDRKAHDLRKANKPQSTVEDVAKEMGISLLSEENYRALQSIFPFDLKTSSWVQTPSKIRSLGGALFCDRRYNEVFTYHNGADSYYAARGFRGMVKI